MKQSLISKLRDSFLCFKIPDNHIGYLKGVFLTMISEAYDFCTAFMQDDHWKKEVLKYKGLTMVGGLFYTLP